MDESESDALEAALDRYFREGTAIVSSSLARIEVTRALRSRLDDRRRPDGETTGAIDGALSGIAERPITEEVVSLARRIAPSLLRTLDAVHLATAVLLDVDLTLTYDDRLADACRENGLATAAPGRDTA